MTPRKIFFVGSALAFALVGVLALVSHALVWLFAPAFVVFGLGVYDLVQKRHAIRRNFPVAGRFRYLFEKVRPELHQYFVESNTSGRPFARELRSLVYQRAKGRPTPSRSAPRRTSTRSATSG